MNATQHGQVCIVTGGASGIGRAIVHAVAERGAFPVIFDIDLAGAETVVSELAKRGHKGRAMNVDVRDRAAVSSAVNQVFGEHRRLDAMFNIAGVSVLGEVLDYDWAAWQDVLDTNLMGVVHGVAAAYPLMVQQRSGHIVNMGSLASIVPTPWATSYTAAKCGVWGLSLALRVEAAPYGVKVCCVCPAAVKTPMVDRSRFLNVDKARAFEAVPGNRISAEVCAEAILKGMQRDHAVITPSAAKWMSLAYRLTPDGAEKMMASVAQKLSALRAEYLQSSNGKTKSEPMGNGAHKVL